MTNRKPWITLQARIGNEYTDELRLHKQVRQSARMDKNKLLGPPWLLQVGPLLAVASGASSQYRHQAASGASS